MSLYERYRDREMAATRLQAELATARLQALRRHLQPHFLFNSLHSVAALARAGDTAGVVRLVAALSELLRYVLEAGDRHGTLREELQIVERYLEIQRARFSDRLDVTLTVAPDAVNARVPLFIVRPLVENAVRHGLAPRVRAGSLSSAPFETASKRGSTSKTTASACPLVGTSTTRPAPAFAIWHPAWRRNSATQRRSR